MTNKNIRCIINIESEVKEVTKLEKALCERIEKADNLIQKQKRHIDLSKQLIQEQEEYIDLLKQDIKKYEDMIERLTEGDTTMIR